MLIVYIGLYTLLLAFIWWVFIVAKIHAYKFKNFSHQITKVTNVLMVILIILSLLWYILIFTSWTGNSRIEVEVPKSDFSDFDSISY